MGLRNQASHGLGLVEASLIAEMRRSGRKHGRPPSNVPGPRCLKTVVVCLKRKTDMPIKLSKLVPKNVRKPLNTRAQNKRKSIEKAAEFPHENYELRELLKNTKPRNIPQSVEEKCKALSPNAISTMIREVFPKRLKPRAMLTSGYCR